MLEDFIDRTCRHITKDKRAIAGADQAANLKPQMFKHTPHFAVLDRKSVV